MLYVLDEPSIGLHPSNIVGLTGVMHDLIADGNSVVLVDHDTQVLAESDWLIEMGPEAGAGGGHVIARGHGGRPGREPGVPDRPVSLRAAETCCAPGARPAAELFAEGRIHLSTDAIHTVKPLEVDIPKGRLTVVTGVSGSGKTTLVLESLVPALAAQTAAQAAARPHQAPSRPTGIAQVKLIDATPIGINVRSTVATYANVHDELRKRLCPHARCQGGWATRRATSPTTQASCAAPVCDGTGVISLDVQFLPDVDIPCTGCRGSRYSREPPTPCGTRTGTAGPARCRSSWTWTSTRRSTVCTDLKIGEHSA